MTVTILRATHVTDTNAVIMWKPTPKNRSDFIQIEVKSFDFGNEKAWANHSRYEVSAARNKINIPQLEPGVRHLPEAARCGPNNCMEGPQYPMRRKGEQKWRVG